MSTTFVHFLAPYSPVGPGQQSTKTFSPGFDYPVHKIEGRDEPIVSDYCGSPVRSAWFLLCTQCGEFHWVSSALVRRSPPPSRKDQHEHKHGGDVGRDHERGGGDGRGTIIEVCNGPDFRTGRALGNGVGNGEAGGQQQ